MNKLIFTLLITFLCSNATAATAFFDYEKTSGLTKICYYTYLGETYAITVKNYEICPLTIEI